MATSSIPAYSAPFAPRARPTLGSVLARAQAMLLARRTRALLSEMDGHMLADIGVSRGDAHMESARPFWDLGAGHR